MWLDILALLILAGFAIGGLLRGGLATGMALLSLLVAYAVGFGCATAFGPQTAATLEIHALLGPPLVGSLAFMLAFLAMGLLTAFLKRVEKRRRAGSRSVRDRFLGACLGLVRGGLVVVLLCLLAIWLDVLRANGTADFLPAVGSSRAAIVTGDVVEASVTAALSDAGPSARVAARLIARPGVSLAELQAVLENPRVTRLQQDQLFWTYVETGAVDAALNRASFIDVLHDRDLLLGFESLGVIDAQVVDDPSQFRDLAEQALREIGPRIRGMRDDPELQRLMSDPEVVSMIESGDTLALLGHSGFRSFVSSVASR
jgi:uncharacterized membrane protein required for colicin V production